MYLFTCCFQTIIIHLIYVTFLHGVFTTPFHNFKSYKLNCVKVTVMATIHYNVPSRIVCAGMCTSLSSCIGLKFDIPRACYLYKYEDNCKNLDGICFYIRKDFNLYDYTSQCDTTSVLTSTDNPPSSASGIDTISTSLAEQSTTGITIQTATEQSGTTIKQSETTTQTTTTDQSETTTRQTTEQSHTTDTTTQTPTEKRDTTTVTTTQSTAEQSYTTAKIAMQTSTEQSDTTTETTTQTTEQSDITTETTTQPSTEQCDTTTELTTQSTTEQSYTTTDITTQPSTKQSDTTTETTTQPSTKQSDTTTGTTTQSTTEQSYTTAEITTQTSTEKLTINPTTAFNNTFSTSIYENTCQIDAAALLTDGFILISGNLVYFYNSVEDMFKGPTSSSYVSILFPQVTGQIDSAYTSLAMDYLYIITGTIVHTYSVPGYNYIGAQSDTEHFGTNNALQFLDNVIQYDTETHIFSTNDEMLLLTNGNTDVIRLDNNGNSNPYRADNKASRPIAITAVCHVSSDVVVFFESSAIKQFQFTSKKGVWTELGNVIC